MRLSHVATSTVKLAILCVIAWLIWHFAPVPSHQLTKFDLEELAENTQPEVPVHVGVVSQQTMRSYMTVYGVVEPATGSATMAPAGASVSAPFRALVTEVNCVEGQQVARGQPLFTMDTREADAEIERARRALEAENKNLEQLRADPKTDGTPRWRILQAELQSQLAQFSLNLADSRRATRVATSPVAGTVVGLQIRPGEITNPAVTAVEVIDLARLVIAVDVPAFDLNRVHLGEDALVEMGAGNDSSSGSVSRIDSAVNAATGMGSVDITVPAGTTLRPGQTVRVQIAIENRPQAMTVPADSIVHDSQGRPAVATLIRNGRWAQLQPVEIGLRENGYVEVRGSKLVAGQPIVTNGSYALPDSAAIRVLKDQEK